MDLADLCFVYRQQIKSGCHTLSGQIAIRFLGQADFSQAKLDRDFPKRYGAYPHFVRGNENLSSNRLRKFRRIGDRPKKRTRVEQVLHWTLSKESRSSSSNGSKKESGISNCPLANPSRLRTVDSLGNSLTSAMGRFRLQRIIRSASPISLR
jgi:hypothetical protein